MNGTVLIVDDEPRIGAMLRRALKMEGIDATACEDPERALELLKEKSYDIVISDLRMPGIDGLELLRRAKQIRPECEVVLMTAYATVATAREALKRGAVDYITKPFSVEDELKPLVFSLLGAGSNEEDAQGAEESAGVSRGRGAGPEGPTSAVAALAAVVGRGPAMRDVIDKACRIARSDAPVLLRGESGTGKEVIANLIHSMSDRSATAMVKINCAALPESLLESELFGYTKGSFTGATTDRTGLFQAADGGTLLLDEIGEISTTFQPKLLRVLQEGEFHRIGDPRRSVTVDVRIIASTNRNLEEAVRGGSFRQDLYYRLNVVPLDLPPLRDRMEDLPELLNHFVGLLSDGKTPHFSEECLQVMQRYSWPGNVRELANAVEYALVLGGRREIGPGDLPVAIQDHQRMSVESPRARGGDGETLEEIEMRCILQAMTKTGFNRTRAARILGVTRRTLGYRIAKYDLEEQIATLRTKQLDPKTASERKAGKGNLPDTPSPGT
ncbi:MAG: sigma-54-dependent Fis family transcriptional regulator [Deltaproteobacteria bacterium]|nr:sigma-54-dependent Fis family transcriptional regulator [Deltaproteobacteria bacterium]MBW2419658.1 sigma-54-dependent Fis family transcriptional regulator [Deltaproteobacteria bacterium]